MSPKSDSIECLVDDWSAFVESILRLANVFRQYSSGLKIQPHSTYYSNVIPRLYFYMQWS